MARPKWQFMKNSHPSFCTAKSVGYLAAGHMGILNVDSGGVLTVSGTASILAS